jgi:hypothetical protein
MTSRADTRDDVGDPEAASAPAAPPLMPDPDLIANREGDERARKRTVAAAERARRATP